MGPNGGGGGGDLSRTGISTMGSADFAGISKVETLKFFLLTLKDLIGNSLAVNLPSFFSFFLFSYCIFASSDHPLVPPPSTCPFISNSTWKYRNKFPVAYCTSTDGSHFARILPIYFFFLLFRSFYDEEEDILIQNGPWNVQYLRIHTYTKTSNPQQ